MTPEVSAMVMRIVKFFYRPYLLRVKPWVIRRMGITLGANCRVYTPLANLDNIAPQLIRIGDNCCLSRRAVILTHDFSRFGFDRPETKPVTLGNNVFVGKNAIILPGVSIGDNCVVGAGAVVTRDVAANTVCAGNPAAPICTYDEYLRKAAHS